MVQIARIYISDVHVLLGVQNHVASHNCVRITDEYLLSVVDL